eukprot:GFUD01014179.1.p1 GENE.GFUD01014179.1~~GFUD01014179.1.p1  ORF type:complete len:623 (-),score=176.96 GFUD01014179.1:158-2026(-)
MINCIWFVVGALGLLQISPSLAMSLFGDDPVRVNFCCPDGEMLRLRISKDQLLGSWSYHMAECVRRKGAKNTLEGMEVSFLDSKNNQTEVKRKLAKLDNKMPKCGRGLQISALNFNQTNLYANGTSQLKPSVSIELRQYNESVTDARQGNVYMDGKPVCDDGWDRNAARVACRELGFADGEPTVGSQYGNVEDDMAMDEISCRGDESSLYECDYTSLDDCGGAEGAGVVCSDTDGSTVSVDLSGKLVLRAEEVDTEDYCLAETWELADGNLYESYQTVPYRLDGFDGTLALSCDQCMEEVVCFYVRSFLENFGAKVWDENVQISGGDGDFFINNIVRIVDKNGDNEVNLEEFKSKIDEYLTIAFNILDRDDDGSIDEVLTNESIKEYSLEFFEQLLKIVVEYFDSNEDESISTADFISEFKRSDRNEDGKVTIYELTGLSLINLPAPLYTAYTLLDENQDEILTLDEMLSFLRRTFTIIDKNADCYINLKEIVAALGESGLKEDFQLGVTLIGQQYLTLAKYFVDGFIAKADTNEDTKVTLAEILKFPDFSFIDRSIQIALSMGYPNGPTFAYLTGENRYTRRGSWREGGDRAVVVWLTTLNTFLDNPVYQSAPAQCGLAGQ